MQRASAVCLAWLMLLVALACGACAGAGGVGAPPPVMPEVLPAAPPAGVSAEPGEGGARVVAGEDGFLYAVGLVGARVGDGFALRYGGEWPGGQGEAPVVGFGRAAQVFEGGAALLQLEYLMPNADLDEVEPELWSGSSPPDVGKGLARLSAVGGREVALSLGLASGIQRGDRYLVLGEASGSGRLGERVRALVVVTEVTEEGARARIEAGEPREGQWALFVEQGLVEAPLRAVVQVAQVKGGGEEERRALVEGLKEGLKALGAQEISVEPLDVEVDPLDPYLDEEAAGLAPSQSPRMLVAAKVDGAGLVVTYQNTGPSVSHAMIAATPEEGIALREKDEEGRLKVSPLLYNLLAALETHRGDNGRALFVLEQALRQPGWDGPARWHARDQVAMRWAQAGRTRAALRGVLEDVALARAREDVDAEINAVGTLMPLYEDLELMPKSLEAARRFYELRREKGGAQAPVFHARRAWIEALFKGDAEEEAERELAALERECGPALEEARSRWAEASEATGRRSCVLDVYYATLTFYWRGDEARRQRALGRLEELAPLMGEQNVAGLRVIQGLEAMRGGDTEGAQIAFLEARRLFEKGENLSGMARVDSLNYQLFLGQERRQLAFEAAMSGAGLYGRGRDLHELTGLYRSLTRLFVNVPPEDLSIAPYAQAAQKTLTEALRLQLGAGDLGGAAEVFYVSGRFRMASNPEEGKELLERARGLSVRATRFDVTALIHLTLAFYERARGDGASFQANLTLAEEYARMSGDAGLLQTVIRAREGSAGEDERDTL